MRESVVEPDPPTGHLAEPSESPGAPAPLPVTWSDADLDLLAEIAATLSEHIEELTGAWTERVFPLVARDLPAELQSPELIVAVHRNFLESLFRNLRLRSLDLVPPQAFDQLLTFLRLQRLQGGELRTTLAHLYFSLDTVTTVLFERLREIYADDPRLPAMVAVFGRISLQVSKITGAAFYEVRSEEMQEALRIVSSLLETSHELNARAGSVPGLLSMLSRIVQRLVRCDLSLTLLQRRDEDVFVIEAASGLSAADLAELQALRFERHDLRGMGAAFYGKLVCGSCDDAHAPPELMKRFEQKIYAAAPMTSPEGRPFGALVACRGEAVPFSSSDLEILRGVAENAALAIENAKLVEKLETAAHVKSDFINSMSHEIRTPLHVLVGYLDMLLDRAGMGSEEVDLLQRMQSNTRYLLKLVNSILDLGRIEAGRMPLHPETFAAGEIVAALQQMFTSGGHKPGVRFVCTAAGELQSITTDRLKLLEILSNLVANAFKFTDQGQVTVTASNLGDGTVLFEVSDTGLGIDKKMLDTIFDVFRQAGPADRGGTGLGLYIVRRLTTLLGGTVSVESEAGKGSTFRVRIPAVIPRQPSA